MLWPLILIIFVFGLIVGSFLTAFTHRDVRGESVTRGRSICPNCKSKISWYDNIPLVSFLLLSGKCRKCKKKISFRYPLIEIITALTFLFVSTVYFQCGSGINTIFPENSILCFWKESLGSYALPYLLFIASALIGIFVTDIEKQMIPDSLSYSLFAITAVVILAASPEDLYFRLFTGFVVSLLFLVLHIITLGRGMGLGDVKLVLFAGMFLGFKYSLVWIFMSFVIGATVGVLLILASKAKFGKQIAFGPFLIVSFFLIMFFGDLLLGKFFPYL